MYVDVNVHVYTNVFVYDYVFVQVYVHVYVYVSPFVLLNMFRAAFPFSSLLRFGCLGDSQTLRCGTSGQVGCRTGPMFSPLFELMLTPKTTHKIVPKLAQKGH